MFDLSFKKSESTYSSSSNAHSNSFLAKISYDEMSQSTRSTSPSSNNSDEKRTTRRRGPNGPSSSTSGSKQGFSLLQELQNPFQGECSRADFFQGNPTLQGSYQSGYFYYPQRSPQPCFPRSEQNIGLQAYSNCFEPAQTQRSEGKKKNTVMAAKYKTVKCRHFHGQNFCQFGSRCQFIHKEDNISKFQPTYFENLTYKILEIEKHLATSRDIGEIMKEVDSTSKVCNKRLPVFARFHIEAEL